MSLDLFFKNFDLITTSPNGVAKLREMILDLAVRGRLVEQNCKDEPAEVLLEKIRAEKKRIKHENGKAKLFDDFEPIDEGEIPFPIPEGWIWLKLIDVGYDWGQKKPDVEFTYIDVSSINKEKGYITNDVTIIQPDKAPSRARKIVKKDSVIYSTVRPYLLNIAIITDNFDPEPIVSTAFAVIHPYGAISNKFLYLYLRSKPFIEYVESQMKGMAYPAINNSGFYNGLMPIPPFEEQKQIVEKVYELMRLCDRLENLLNLQLLKSSNLVDSLISHI